MTIDSRISWTLTDTLQFYGSYSYISSTTDAINGNVDQNNNRLNFGVLYRGVGFRR